MTQPIQQRISKKIGSWWPRYRPQPRIRRGPLPVMFVITSMPVGGAEVLLANLIRGFDRQRIEPVLICLKQAGPLGEQLAAACPVHANLLCGKWDIRVLPRLVRLFRQHEAAAVVTVGAGDKMFWGRLAGWIAGVPAIFSAIHSTGWPDGISKLNRKLTRITDGFIAVADQHADHLRTAEGLPAEHVVTIRNGVDTERFRPQPEQFTRLRADLGIAESAPVFGIVAALRPEKNHAMFLRVARQVCDQVPAAKFLIIGDGPERAKLEQLVEQLQLQDSVKLLGTRADTADLLSVMDAFLLCSLNEASPVSVLEALACQVPVVSTRVGSVAESVIDGETGFLVAVEDDQAMAERLIYLLANPEVYAAMGARGRALVEARGSLTAMVNGYTELVEQQYDRCARRRNLERELIDRRQVDRQQAKAEAEEKETKLVSCATSSQASLPAGSLTPQP